MDNKEKDWPSIKDAKPVKKTDVKYDPHMKVMAPQVKKESMNYSEYLDHLDQARDPLYTVEGELPRCPPGYIWDRKRKDCVPKTEKDGVKGKLVDKDNQRGTNQFNVWGQTGLNGDGYAYGEPFVNNTGEGSQE